MEKDQGFIGEGKAGWNSCSQTNEVKCCFLNPNWDNSMDQSGPFESALACSPGASNAGSSNFPGSGDNVMLRELVGKLGNICNTYTGDSKEESSISVGGESSIKGQNDANARKRKSAPSPAPEHAKVLLLSNSDDKSDAKRSKQQNGNVKAANKEIPKPLEPPKDYIHIRARRGQATDSHSLAERVRREKISERMKFLQDLVPGCNKVTGKAVMLDEIINYVQSLQCQVEFLSMKLATVNPRMNVNMEALLSKDSGGSLPHALYSMDSSAPAFESGYQPQQALPMNNGMSNNTEIQFSMNPITAALHKTQGLQLPPVDGFTNANPQIGSFWMMISKALFKWDLAKINHKAIKVRILERDCRIGTFQNDEMLDFDPLVFGAGQVKMEM